MIDTVRVTLPNLNNGQLKFWSGYAKEARQTYRPRKLTSAMYNLSDIIVLAQDLSTSGAYASIRLTLSTRIPQRPMTLP